MMFYSCPFCEGKIVLYWEKISIWQCRSCRLLFRNPQIDDATLIELYASSWKNPMAHRSETGGTTPILAKTYSENLLKTLGLNDFKGLKILDFGAGEGIMSRALKDAGADVWAIEPFGPQVCRLEGISKACTLDELGGKVRFDGIVCIDVIEHLKWPWEHLSRFHDILKPHGWLYLATPNAMSLNAQFLKEKWREAQRTSHLFFFKPVILEKFFEYAGFYSWRRLRWFIRYSSNPIRQLLHFLLQLTLLDGEIRYIAIKK